MTFREQLRAIIAAALERNYPDAGSLRFDVSKPREKSFGDFATNVAMVASKPLALKPMEIAEKLAKDLESSDLIESVDVAPPGFINFVISRHAYLEKLREIITAEDDEHYGYVNLGEGKKIQVEFVSANPTGPLSVGHGRLAAFGVTAVDTTGAGDAFHAAFCAGIAWGLAWHDLLRFSSAVGALTCLQTGARPALPRKPRPVPDAI